MKKPTSSTEDFAPLFAARAYTDAQRRRLAPFFTNLDNNVYAPQMLSPEVVGALCSRTSRAADDLRVIFANEYITPFLDAKQQDGEDTAAYTERVQYGKELQAFIDFLHEHPVDHIFSNPKARSFYTKWLAQYGDDSIAQMAGMHLVYTSLSQLAIKHIEDQRIGLAPLEKSTRYVDYSKKVNGSYQYYTDPTLADMGLMQHYTAAMDMLFETYTDLVPKLSAYISRQFPDESPSVVEKKSFDTLRGLLPVSTLSQLALFGNGQAFEYMVSRSMRHPLGEVRWAAERAYDELYQVAPSFLRRVKDEDRRQDVTAYQEYLAQKPDRMMPYIEEYVHPIGTHTAGPTVDLVERDSEGEANIIAGMLYNAPNNTASWRDTISAVHRLEDTDREAIVEAYLSGRDQRWQKVGRAFENAYVRFEITMNIGAWRDLHRHRMMTQQRQQFTCNLGYDMDDIIARAGLADRYTAAMDHAKEVYKAVAQHDRHVAQYAVPMAYRTRFQQYKNVRQCFWEMELRTIPEGHPDYRIIEQKKFALLEQVYPLLAKYMRVNTGQYDFARRGQEEKIQQKLKELERMNI